MGRLIEFRISQGNEMQSKFPEQMLNPVLSNTNCSQLNKWALSKFLRKIENPNPTQPYPEPGHYCGD